MKFETLSVDLGCFPLNVQYLSTAVGLRPPTTSLFPVYTRSVQFDLPSLAQSFTPLCLPTGTASTAFVENKLSRSLLSLSPLFTILPRSLQRTLVRPSMNCYIHFSLIMNSSPRFVSLRWESSDLSSFLAFTLSSRFRFNSSPSTKLVDPLYHKYSVIPSWDSQWISVVQFLVRSLTVLFTINHVNFPSP